MKSYRGTPKWSYERSRVEEGHQLRGPWEEGQKPNKTYQYICINAIHPAHVELAGNIPGRR
jgi:hypothetical protein